MSDTYLAIVQTPLGVWEDTATVCTGHEAMYAAKRGAKAKFVRNALPPFMTESLELLVESFWRAAEKNGCRLIVREISIEAEHSI